MKLIFPIIAIALMCAVAQSLLPWWSIAPVAFVISYLFRLKAWTGFLAGFAGVFLLWAGMAITIDYSNDHILSSKIAMLFPLKGNYYLLFLITGLVGGLVAGFASLSGALLRRS